MIATYKLKNAKVKCILVPDYASLLVALRILKLDIATEDIELVAIG